MSFLSLFRKPAHTEVAELRDRCIVAETKAILLADELERARRAKRERRKDATDISRAIAARAQAYSDRFSRLTPEEAKAARAAASSRAA